jgi:2-polyprenyl-3-methyl-5-hydroxy-6-metoxy-1,4-benzoquinol methylase
MGTLDQPESLTGSPTSAKETRSPQGRPKATSHPYGAKSQERMLAKYDNRHKNHWSRRIGYAKELVERYARPALGGKPPGEILLVDVGCSIGTFAIEFAKEGYSTVGVDFDPEAIRIAQDLAVREGVSAQFVCADLADWSATSLPPIGIAVCFDIFEHLHDDEIGALLLSLKRSLARDGRVVFSTTPTKFTYLWEGGGVRTAVTKVLVKAMRWLPQGSFEKYVLCLAALTDMFLVLRHGRSHDELIKLEKHCNPLTATRLEDIFRRAGFAFDRIDTINLHPEQDKSRTTYRKHPITHTHIVGSAFVRP